MQMYWNKESVYLRKEFNSHRIGYVWGTNMIAVTSAENALYMKIVYENCGVKNYIKEHHRSCRRNFCSCGKRA